jgi:hypothetical protein
MLIEKYDVIVINEAWVKHTRFQEQSVSFAFLGFNYLGWEVYCIFANCWSV